MKTLDVIAAVLVVVGGLNWGVWGVFELDLVALLLGGDTALAAKGVYTLIGLSAAYQALAVKAIQRRWRVVPAMA